MSLEWMIFKHRWTAYDSSVLPLVYLGSRRQIVAHWLWPMEQHWHQRHVWPEMRGLKFGEIWSGFGKWRLGFWMSHQLLGKAVNGDIKLSGRFWKLWVPVKWKALAVDVLSFCQLLWYSCCFWDCRGWEMAMKLMLILVLCMSSVWRWRAAVKNKC